MELLQEQQLWTPDCGSPRCEATKDGKQCLLINMHDAAQNATGHAFPDADVVDDETPHAPTDAEAADIGRPLESDEDPEVQAALERIADEDSERAIDEEARNQPPALWICTNCGTSNDPAPADAIVEKCSKCGEPSEGQKARIAAGLGAINIGVGTAADVEETARKLEGVAPAKPADRPLPLRGTSSTGRFDIDDAWEQLAELREQVVFCERDHEADVKRAKASGQRLKEAEEEYFTQFDAFSERREKAAIQPDLYAEQERREALASSDCQVERSTGAPCPACQSQRAKGKPADATDPLHPAHPQHEDVAKALLIKDLNDLRARLEKKNWFLDVAELQALPVAQLQAVQRYGAQRGRIPGEGAAELIKRAHLAAEPGTDRQECKHCGIALVERKDIDAGVTFYPANVVVGLDCEGKTDDAKPDAPATPAPKTSTAAAADEAPRKPKSHAKKDGKKKPQPEQHRQAQAAEGRKKNALKPARGKDPAVKGKTTRKKK